jgi:hypothetical protein
VNKSPHAPVNFEVSRLWKLRYDLCFCIGAVRYAPRCPNNTVCMHFVAANKSEFRQPLVAGPVLLAGREW